jgi:hypothetical protein
MINNKIIYLNFMLFFLPVLGVFAQEKDAKNYQIVLLPQFFRYGAVVVNDTTYKFECIGHRNNTLNVDELMDLSQIENITYVKCYFQSPRTGNSPISPPYLTSKQYVYFNNGGGDWVGIDMVTNIKTGFKEDRKQIVRSDTAFIVNHATGKSMPVIHQYYRVEQVDIKTVRKHKE